MRFSAIFLLALLFSGLAAASEVKGTINYGQTVNGNVAGNGVDAYTFNVTKGDTFVISLSETGTHEPNFFPSLELIPPGKSSGMGNSQHLYIKDVESKAVGGIWTAKISRADDEGRPGGSYALTLQQVSGKNAGVVISPGKSYSGSIERGSVDLYSFSGHLGHTESVTVDVTGGDGFIPEVSVFAPDGSMSETSCRKSCNQDIPISANGAYTILVAKSDPRDVKGAYTLSLQDDKSAENIPVPQPKTLPAAPTPMVDRISPDLEVSANPPPMRCDIYPQYKIYGRLPWFVYSCADGNTLLIDADTDNPAAPYTFKFSLQNGKYHLEAGGAGRKELAEGAFKELSALSDADIAALIVPFMSSCINISTGNKCIQAEDYMSDDDESLLSFARYYNSFSERYSLYPTTLGPNWRSNYDRKLRLISPHDDGTVTMLAAERGDGQVINFYLKGGVWTHDSDLDYTLTNVGDTWTLTDTYGTVETYVGKVSAGIVDAGTGNKATLMSIKTARGYTRTLNYAGGVLTSVTDSDGGTLGFSYDHGMLTKVKAPGGMAIIFGYTAVAGKYLLTSVSYNTSPVTGQNYLYEGKFFPFMLTGVTNQDGTRRASMTYDSIGRAISQARTGGAVMTKISYDDATGNSIATKPNGRQELYKFTELQNMKKVTEVDWLINGKIAKSRMLSYDANGYLTNATNYDGSADSFVNNSHGRLVGQTHFDPNGTPSLDITDDMLDGTAGGKYSLQEPNRPGISQAELFEDGKIAFDHDDYPSALKYWQPLGTQGYADAERALGEMYFSGKGVAQDYLPALLWSSRAALQGDADAQFEYGMMQAGGLGTKQDYSEAYFWLSLAAKRKSSQEFATERDKAAANLTPEQRATIDKLTAEWKPTPVSPAETAH